STSLPAGTALAQVIWGLLSYLVVANLHVTMQDASPASEFVIRTLAISSPGRMAHSNGTASAATFPARKMASADPTASGATCRNRQNENASRLPGSICPQPDAAPR